MTDEPDPADAEQVRRARLRVVGDDEAAAAGPVPPTVGASDAVRGPLDRGRADHEAVDGEAVGDEMLGGETVVDTAVADEAESPEWAWVAEWRESGEPVPWATGLPLAAFAAVLAGVAIWVLSAGLADRPVLAVVLNLLVAGGLVPAMWLSRNLPVLRWFAAGAAVGVVGGWIAALMML